MLLVILALAIIAILLPDTKYKKTNLYALKQKHLQLALINKPKIIVVGGSNCAFGIDSKMLADSTNKPVYNMAIHGGLGLRYILEDVKYFAKKGDIIIVSPEYPQFSSNFYGADELLVMVFDVLPNTKNRLNLEHWFKLLDRFPYYIGNKWYYLYQYFFPSKENIKPYYAVNSFDNSGDEVKHLGLKNVSFGLNPYLQKPHKNVAKAIASFSKDMDNKGIKVYLTFAPFQKSSYLVDTSNVDSTQELLKEYSIEVISKVKDYVFEDSLFFNTAYHLNQEGRKIRTERLLIDIKNTEK